MAKPRRKGRRNPEDFPTGQFVDVEKMKVNTDAAGNVTSIDIVVADGDLPSSMLHPVASNRGRARRKTKKKRAANKKRTGRRQSRATRDRKRAKRRR